MPKQKEHNPNPKNIRPNKTTSLRITQDISKKPIPNNNRKNYKVEQTLRSKIVGEENADLGSTIVKSQHKNISMQVKRTLPQHAKSNKEIKQPIKDVQPVTKTRKSRDPDSRPRTYVHKNGTKQYSQENSDIPENFDISNIGVLTKEQFNRIFHEFYQEVGVANGSETSTPQVKSMKSTSRRTASDSAGLLYFL